MTETEAETDNWPGSQRGAISADMATGASRFIALNTGACGGPVRASVLSFPQRGAGCFGKGLCVCQGPGAGDSVRRLRASGLWALPY